LALDRRDVLVQPFHVGAAASMPSVGPAALKCIDQRLQLRTQAWTSNVGQDGARSAHEQAAFLGREELIWARGNVAARPTRTGPEQGVRAVLDELDAVCIAEV